MEGTVVKAFCKENDNRGEEGDFDVEEMTTERELVEAEGFEYARIPILDHSWPSVEEVETFVDLVKGTNADNTWLHIHCHAGKGRTVVLLAMLDKMRNPNVGLEDICIRQTMMGGTYPLYTNPSEGWKAPLYEEKAKMIRLFFDYVEHNVETGYEVSWGQWLAGHREA